MLVGVILCLCMTTQSDGYKQTKHFRLGMYIVQEKQSDLYYNIG